MPQGATQYDCTTSAAIGIEIEHHGIHDGVHFYISGFESEDTNGTIDFAITTPNTSTVVHMNLQVEGVSQTELYIYESASTSGGTAVVPFNNNRNSTNASVAVVAKDPTVAGQDTLIYSQSSGLAGVTPIRTTAEGLINRSREIMLKKNKKYLFRIVSKGDSNIISYYLYWYEYIAHFDTNSL